MKNFRINKNRPPLSDADLTSGKDFGQLMKTYSAMKTPFYKTAKFWFGGTAALVTAVAAVLLLSKVTNNNDGKQPVTASVTNFINPPIAAANISSAMYLIEAGKDSVLSYVSGSQIMVPANAFLDENGQVVSGQVELSYREFHNSADVFLAGIPMTYDSAGETFHFETAGMMEIAAKQNGKNLRTNPNAIIQVKMVSAKQDDRFNTYFLDTTNKRWEYLSQGNYVKQQQQPAPKTPLAKSNNKGKQQLTGDEALKQQSEEYRKLCDAVTQVETEKPVAPKKLEKKKSRFSIKVDEKEFPELAAYNNLKFEVVNEAEYDSKKADVLWEDVQLKRIDASQNYEIMFSKGNTHYSVTATPAMEEKDYEAAKKVFDQKYKEYEVKLAERKAEQEKLKEELIARSKAIEEKIQKEIEAQQQRIKDYEAALQQSSLFYRMFSVQNFGTWNCDQPQRLPTGASVVASFVDRNTGKQLDLQTAYLVEPGRDIMFSYYPGNFNTFRFNPTAENLVWGVTSNQKICVMKREEFRSAAKKDGKATFAMEVLDKKFSNTDEVKDYLGI